VKDIKDAAGGDGPHSALVSAASVSLQTYEHVQKHITQGT
jgi:hypothetical protein